MDQNQKQPSVIFQQLQNIIDQDTPSFIQKIVINLKYILIGAVIFVVIVTTVTGFHMLQTHNLKIAKETLGSIILNNNGKDKVAILEQFLTKIPSDLHVAVLFELTGSSMAEKDYTKALDFWQQLVSVNTGSAKLIASLGHAKALVLANKSTEALAELSSLKAVMSENFQAPLNRQLGLAAEITGDKQTALAAYKNLLHCTEVNDRPYIEFKIAQLETTN